MDNLSHIMEIAIPLLLQGIGNTIIVSFSAILISIFAGFCIGLMCAYVIIAF